MGELIAGIYFVITAVGVIGVFKILPKWRQKEIINYIQNLDK